MKPLTQFEKMRANRARRIAIAREIQHQARWEGYLQGTLSPVRQESLEPYFGHPLNNRRGQQ